MKKYSKLLVCVSMLVAGTAALQAQFVTYDSAAAGSTASASSYSPSGVPTTNTNLILNGAINIDAGTQLNSRTVTLSGNSTIGTSGTLFISSSNGVDLAGNNLTINMSNKILSTTTTGLGNIVIGNSKSSTNRSTVNLNSGALSYGGSGSTGVRVTVLDKGVDVSLGNSYTSNAWFQSTNDSTIYVNGATETLVGALGTGSASAKITLDLGQNSVSQSFRESFSASNYSLTSTFGSGGTVVFKNVGISGSNTDSIYLNWASSSVYGSTSTATVDTLLSKYTFFDGINSYSYDSNFRNTGVLSTSGTFAVNNSTGLVVFNAVPEPSTYALMLGWLLFFGFAIFRKRSSDLQKA